MELKVYSGYSTAELVVHFTTRIILSMILVFSAIAVQAAPPVLTISSGSTNFVEDGAAVAIDPLLTIVEPSASAIDGATVAITGGYVSAEDRLVYTATAGVSGSFNTATGILTLTGSATPADYQVALRTVQYQNINTTNPNTGARTIRYALGSSLSFADNGHFYEFVSASGINWTAARDAAAVRTLFGLQGYLTTVTSANENTFIASKLVGQGWMGASDLAAEGDWRWVTGPEAGTAFWSGLGSGSSVGGMYENWAGGEPNNSGNEDYAHFLNSGMWNDYPLSLGFISGYVVEYGGMSGDPILQITGNKSVNVTSLNDAPSFSAGAVLSTINEDTLSPVGITVSALLAGNFIDGDTNSSLSGIAVSADASVAGVEGDWEYSTDSGSNWFDMGSVSTSSALLLSSTSMLRFKPFSDYSGTPGLLTVFAVDESGSTTYTSGSTRQTFDTTSDDVTSRVAVSGVFVDISVSAINDLPTLTSFAAVLDSSLGGGEVEITLAEFQAQGDEADSEDGIVSRFVIKTVSNGSLKIGASSGTASLFSMGANDTVDATNNAYWSPENNASGEVNAFTVVAEDSDSSESLLAIQATVNVSFLPLLVYDFEDNVNDNSGNENHGVMKGITTFDNAGRSGKALSLSGSGYVELPYDLLRNNQNFTVSLWFKTTSTGGILGYQNGVAGTASGNYVPIISINNAGQLQTELWIGNSMLVTSTATVNDGQWHRVVMTADTTNGNLSVYLDGVSIGSVAGTIQHLDMSFNQLGLNDSMGRTGINLPATRANYFTGLLDEFTFYSKALSAVEIAKTSQSISFPSITDQLLSQGTLSLAATASSALTVSYISTTETVCTVEENTLTLLSIGTCTIQAHQTGDATYSAAAQVSRSFAVVNTLAPVLTISSGSTSFVEDDSAVAIDPLLTIVEPSASAIDGATVAIAGGYVSAEDRLIYATTAGVSGSFNATTGILTLTGSATPADYQMALRAVQYQNINTTNPDTGTRTIRYALGSSLSFADNGHFYEFVSASGINWTAARDAAAVRTLFGLQGYLTTVTSANENTFIASKLVGQGWMGASDLAAEGDWRWVTGPEAGTAFWSGLGSGSSVGGMYENWAGGEPNNSGNEDYAHFLNSGMWNDYPLSLGSTISGYVVEYGGMSGDPTLQITGNKSINVTSLNDAPSFSAGAVLSAINEDTLSPVGITVSTLLAGNFNDGDPSSSLSGIAVSADTSVAGVEGGWEYSTDNGSNWFDMGSVSTSSALLLSASTQLRFKPFINYSGIPGPLTVFAVDASGSITYTSEGVRQAFDTTVDDVTSAVSVTGVSIVTNVVAVNDAPVITSDGGAATAMVTVIENQTTVTTITSTDAESNAVTYSLTGGPDQARFSLVNGVLTFANYPDFETPSDSDSNNTYVVEVTATDDGSGALTDTQTITVMVSNVNELPTVGAITASHVTQSNAGENLYSFTVVYADVDGNFDSATLDTADVTVSGGALVSAVSWSGNGFAGTATYTVAPPGGSWDDSDNGTYTIAIIGNQVGDSDSGFVAANAGAASFSVLMDSTGPVIGSVTMPDVAMKVGDTVTATIAVEDDSGNTYSNVSGTLGGFALSNLVRVNSTTYTIKFTVTEGGADVVASASVPVSLNLNDSLGNTGTYTGVINQSADSIDANSPTVNSVSIANVVMKVGDVVVVNITASEAGATLLSGMINGVAVKDFVDNHGGSYSATYTILEGHSDRAAGDAIPVSFQLQDGAGNVGNIYTHAVVQTADAIDANSPSSATGALAVNENAGNGTSVGTVSAAGAVSYSLTDNGAGRFAIHATTGLVTVLDGSLLDYETNISHNLTVRVVDAVSNATDTVLVVMVNNVNEAPLVAGLDGDSVSFNVGGSAVNLDDDLDTMLTMVDSIDMDGGNVTAAIVANAQPAEDVLQVGVVGNITLSGSNVVHSDGLTIGIVAGGTEGKNLVVKLNVNASFERVRDLVSALQYDGSDDASVNTATRMVRITLDDGDGQNSTTLKQNVSVVLVRAPIIDLDGDDSSGNSSGGFNASFTEDGGVVALADSDDSVAEANDTVISDDGSFKSLLVTLNNRPDGNAEGLSSSYGSGVQLVNDESVTIGVYDGASGELLLTVDDNAATAETMELLIESLRYDNSAQAPDTTDRSISFVAIDDADNVSSAVTASLAIVAVNDAPTGRVNMTGALIEGLTLLADTSTIVDLDGLSMFSYQWQRDGIDISGAIGASYVLTNADVGRVMTVVVSYTDAGGRLESLNDIASAVVDGDLDGDGLGDSTDADIDGDGLSNVYETANGLDSRDNSDRDTDADGDGVSNYDEFVAGTDASTDDNPPILSAPADITVNATGLYTAVELGNATAFDVTDGVLTAQITHLDGEAVLVLPTHFSPGAHVVTWAVSDAANNRAVATQNVNVVPLVEFSKNQISTEGATAHFKVILNGSAVTYPVTVPYTVSGTAAIDGSDHDLVDGSVTINSPDLEATVSVALVDDGVGEGMETLVIKMGTPDNAVPGSKDSHNVDIYEGNVAPRVSLSASQGDGVTRLVTQAGGLVTVAATVMDANVDDIHGYDWSSTDNSLVDADGDSATFSFDPMNLAAGVYTLKLAVSDGLDTVNTRLVLKIVASLPVLTVIDSDGDGVDDATEGYGDSDGDGVPNYLDNSNIARNVAQQLTGDIEMFLMETESDLVLSLGSIAFRSGNSQTGVSDSEIEQYASNGVGGVVDEHYAFNGGLFDFSIEELPVSGQSVSVVVVQYAPIPANAVYRKLMASGWQDFVEDNRNHVASTQGIEGYCPPPGDSSFSPGLTQGHWCVQLTIEDGGPNDADGLVNQVIRDPGGVAVLTSTPVAVKVTGGGGGVSLWAMLLLGLMLGAAHLNGRGRRVVLAMFCGLGGLGVANAQSPLVPDYIGFHYLSAKSDERTSDFQSEIDNLGLSASVTQTGLSRSGWSAFVGYQVEKFLALEIGYVDLGESSISLSGLAPDVDAFINTVDVVYPVTGSGFTFNFVGRISLSNKIDAWANVGAFLWETTYDLSGETVSKTFTDSGLSNVIGLGLEMDVVTQVPVRFGWTMYRFGGADVGAWTLGVGYRF